MDSYLGFFCLLVQGLQNQKTFFRWEGVNNCEIFREYGDMTFLAMIINIRLRFTTELFTSTSGDPTMFRDTSRKLLFSLTYVERLTTFTSVFIYEVRLTQLRLPIFKGEMTSDRTVRFKNNLELDLGITVTHHSL